MCPGCQRLVHATRLSKLASDAEAAQQQSDLTGAVTAWRQALTLLPVGTRQRTHVEQRVVALSNLITAGAPQTKQKKGWGGIAGIGATALALLGKGKFLLMGLAKLPTLLTMLAAFGVYWTLWGWKFALGFVLCIYVHEMGHVFALRRYGLPATAPMFIPGIGALVRLNQAPATLKEDARVGLAGPIFGLGVTVFVLAIGLIAHSPFMVALATVSAAINLFNLIPVWTLDGGRAFRSLSRVQKWFLVAAIGGMWLFTHQHFLVFVGIGALWNAFTTKPSEESDVVMTVQYGAVMAILTLLASLHVAGVNPVI
jgi:Zn-dependent protease